ncbi:BRCA1-associated protein [Galleria mellonella]|uniref:BRCA1-associated protein n=1 Tax=Galleria mellonella TaxID=7137 RepID=A0ABM3ML34_GALME|nr:BRCA1-associated protein [Galleria mellonella]
MPVSLCVLRIEIDEELPEMGDNPAEIEAAKEQKKKDRGARESRTITVETYASVLSGPNTDIGILPTSSRRSPPKGSNVSENDNTITFFCGNPLVEVTKGVLHLYKENELKEAAEEAKTLCLLSVPGALGATDLLAFAAACQQDIAHVRVLRDGSPDHYMALLTFRSGAAARAFYEVFDGAPYSSLEPAALCHAAWVARVEWAAGGAAPAAHTELPTCAVCLERMDESVAGVLSVQCAHAFHAACLARWRAARCPVCRAAQVPEPAARAACLACAAEEEEPSEEGWSPGGGGGGGGTDLAEGLLDGVEAGTLWICLICGHVGCGRYERGHAAKHFLASNHTYALQLGSNRVWDYAGDNFVHRLVQNKTDGKLVAAGGGGAEETACGGEEKLDSAQLEFTYILTQQLDSQRTFYEEKIAKLESSHAAELEEARTRAAAAEEAANALRVERADLTRAHTALDRKLRHLTTKVSSLQSQLAEERGLAAALASSHAQWQARAAAREDTFLKEITELKEQLRDVMFFVEARDKLEHSSTASSAELAAATVTVAPPADNRPQRHRRRKR